MEYNEIDEETVHQLELYHEWRRGYEEGIEFESKRSNIIIEELVKVVNQVEAELSEFKNSDGSDIQ